ncbi:hypothetical protein IP92_04644 [Pseudoduganella flava]|uniref:Metal-dependent phosphohydrolase n=1 Tax=Pseudoduganella flava TaxID=871742 RepID=A0A562PI28_9BURK|nr:metal-dependent phosphohydrolase [Pseudoduganella flava]QGZ42776.1 metal-dependent phosphohydrolase [Pseudoduganella flava]TWI44125.1 hypothetical protein IP92_04644 [Pseudoduganella flava]
MSAPGIDELEDPARLPPPSVLRGLNAVQRRLESMQESPAAESWRALARELLHALDLSHDVALACVLRNQIGGTYALRHSVETAVIAALTARHLRVRPVHLLTLTSAALALHTTGRHEAGPHTVRSAEAEHDWFTRQLLAHAPGHAPDEPVLATGARLLRMADRYCAGISARNYRRSLLPDDALARVLADAPDEGLADAFRREIGPFPPGTVVRLEGGETGVVLHRDGGQPEVLCLRDAAGRALPVALPRRAPIACALGDDDCDVRVSMKQVWGPLASL